MQLARSGAIVALVVALAGCGGGGHARRDAVNAYVDRIDRAEASLVAQGAAIKNAFRVFSMRGNPPAEVQALLRAQAEILRARRRIGSIEPPPDARRLHTELLRLLDLEAAVAGDLVWTSRYVPQFERALRPLGPAGARLARDFRHAKGWKASAAVFEPYKSSLAQVLAQLDQLRAPPVFHAALDGKRRSLRRSIALSAAAESALTKRDARAANAAIRSLLAVDPAVVRTRRDEIAAARAYNRRIDEISGLAAQINRERSRLVKELG